MPRPRDEWEEGLSAKLYVRRLGVTPARSPSGDAFRFEFSSDGHFRQHVSGHVEIELRDGVVVIDAEKWEQDESYY